MIGYIFMFIVVILIVYVISGYNTIKMIKYDEGIELVKGVFKLKPGYGKLDEKT